MTSFSAFAPFSFYFTDVFLNSPHRRFNRPVAAYYTDEFLPDPLDVRSEDLRDDYSDPFLQQYSGNALRLCRIRMELSALLSGAVPDLLDERGIFPADLIDIVKFCIPEMAVYKMHPVVGGKGSSKDHTVLLLISFIYGNT